MISRARLYLNTLKYLKLKQIYYQLFHRLKQVILKPAVKDRKSLFVARLNLTPSIKHRDSFNDGSFIFLHRVKKFEKNIDWNFPDYGKLWVYNLNYFDFLNQNNVTVQDGLKLLDAYCYSVESIKVGVEPYPISLRCINWIKFFVYHKINNTRYNSVLFSHCLHLAANLEYHLLGNHLLENGFAMLFAAYYFEHDDFYKKAEQILYSQLNEQILKDGGHFELSPMYHQILLFRLLDSYNLVVNNNWKSGGLSALLKLKAQLMMGWLTEVTFKNGDVPMVNDCAFHISPASKELFPYSKTLSLDGRSPGLSDSGYRMVRKNDYEMFIDVGNIGPDYIPGHAHSDTFNFVLYIKDQPVIVDTGTSTYEWSEQRFSERSTKSHNTVMVNGKEQSEIWASFRVGNRAKILMLSEEKNRISSSHSGYTQIGATHNRSWSFYDSSILITDTIDSMKSEIKSEAFFHFHPSQAIQIREGIITLANLDITFDGFADIRHTDYLLADGFNKTLPAKVVSVLFSKQLVTRLMIKN